MYIQSATLNGKPYTKNWIDHSFFTEGKELVLTLGAKESSWGTAVADLPPSLGTYEGFGNYSGNSTAAGRYRKRAVRFSEVDLFSEHSPTLEKTGGAYWADPEGK